MASVSITMLKIIAMTVDTLILFLTFIAIVHYFQNILVFRLRKLYLTTLCKYSYSHIYWVVLGLFRESEKGGRESSAHCFPPDNRGDKSILG